MSKMNVGRYEIFSFYEYINADYSVSENLVIVIFENFTEKKIYRK